MNVSINNSLQQDLCLLTYNGNDIQIPQDGRLNLFMGIGLWSVKDGLSKGLPVDIMQMLLTAAIMRLQIKEAHPEKPSKVILLIADSMAVQEGAEKEKVSQLILLYKKSLEPLLELLKLKNDVEILLSSDLANSSDYEASLASVEESPLLTTLRTEDKAHYAYMRTQIAITYYMHKYRQVGIKIGWICTDSSKLLKVHLTPHYLKQWDELKFDRWCEIVCQDSTMQYLYAKAGLKQSGCHKQISVSEGCPYTAYDKDRRYIIQTQNKQEIKTICPLQKRVASHWNGIASLCSRLIQERAVDSRLLPEDCIKKSNAVLTVYNMLNHWANISVLASSANNSPHSTTCYQA